MTDPAVKTTAKATSSLAAEGATTRRSGLLPATASSCQRRDGKRRRREEASERGLRERRSDGSEGARERGSEKGRGREGREGGGVAVRSYLTCTTYTIQCYTVGIFRALSVRCSMARISPRSVTDETDL